jgi:hypothetical protein
LFAADFSHFLVKQLELVSENGEAIGMSIEVLGSARRISVVLFCLFATAFRLSAAGFFVSPSGDDSNPGTKSRPFATLERARDAVRAQKQLHPDRDYTVQLRGGVYHLKRAVEFALEDSAAPGHTITYEAYGDEKPVFSSGVPIEGWQKEGQYWTAPMPEGMKPFLTLYDPEGRLQRARGPAFSPTMDYKTETNLDNYMLPFPTGELKNWPNLKDIEIMIRPNYGWVLNMLPLESVDEVTGMARTAVPASYHMIQVRFARHDINSHGTVWVENALEDLNGPGRWVLNTLQRKIYLWPRTPKPENIEAPQLTELIRIEGNINYDGPRDEPVRGLRFKGISFTRGDRWPWEKDRAGWTLQHDWEMFDRPTAMVRLRGAEDIAFEHCHWYDSGGAGVRLDLHAISNRVTDSVLEHLGGTGILLAGYGPGTKYVNRDNEISRNHIHHVGEILWHGAAIALWQSGENHIANNLIHGLNYSAIVVSTRISWNRPGRDGSRTIRWREMEEKAGQAIVPGPGYFPSWEVREPFLHGRDNLVERNEIYDIMQKLWDGDGVYISGTGGGNRIRENFIHDCTSTNMCEGIRCDDDQNGTIIERNVILRNGGIGTGLCMKGWNNLINNFIVDTDGDFLIRGLISVEAVPVTGSVIERNVEYASKPGLKPFFMKSLFGPIDPHYSDMNVDYNLFWHTKDPHWADAHLAEARSDGGEQHSEVGDPLFCDPDNGDFRFRPGSPAPKLGIQPIDLRKVGLR